jgi:hypothetical protein
VALSAGCAEHFGGFHAFVQRDGHQLYLFKQFALHVV